MSRQSIAFRLRGFNFLYFSLFSLFISYLPIYSSSIGVSSTAIGLIIGVGSTISIVSQPFWGMVSDKYKTIRQVLLLLLTLSVAAGTLLYHSGQLWSLVLFVCLMYICFMPTDPLVESLNFQTAQREQIAYGSVRMFGALGYAVTSLWAGYAVKAWGMGSLSWIFLVTGLLALWLALGVRDVQASTKPALFQQLRDFLRQSKALYFLALVLVVAIPHKMNDVFIGLYMEQLGGSVQLTGLSWFVMTLTETLFFALSARWIKPGKEAAIMTAAAGLYAVRFLFSAMVDHPYALVALQIFQGCTFVFFYVGAMQYLHAIVPEQWKSTGQTMLTVLFFGVSGLVGSTAGGWLMDELGGAALYRIMALLSAGGFVMCLLLFGFRRKRVA